jgi:hypothetical protein
MLGGSLLSSGLGVYAIAHHFRHVPDDFTSSNPDFSLFKGTRYRSFDIKEDDPLILQAVRAVTMATGAIVAKVVLRMRNETQILESDAYSAWLSALRQREEGVPLITVSNHESTYDGKDTCTKSGVECGAAHMHVLMCV